MPGYDVDWFSDDGLRMIYVDTPFYTYGNLTSNQGLYRFAMLDVEHYNITSIYIKKAEEGEDLTKPYWGDGKFTEGIHLGIESVVELSQDYKQ